MNKSDHKKLQTGLYIGLAIALILCLFPMPYGFYQFVRFAAMDILFIVLAIFFRPFAKIAFDRVIWNTVDMIVAGYLIYLVVKNNK